MILMYYIKDYFTLGAIGMIMLFALGMLIAKYCFAEKETEAKKYSNEMKQNGLRSNIE